MSVLTSRQRVQTALHHQEPDRVPIDFGGRHSIHMDAHRALKRHLGLDDGEEVVRSYLTFSAEPDPRLLDYFGPDVQAFQCKSGRGFTFRLDPTTDTWSDEWGIKCRRPPGGITTIHMSIRWPQQTQSRMWSVFPFPIPAILPVWLA
jgi:uroporphyrinogen decarboxylase